MQTPEKAYDAGIEMLSTLHGQILLCYEMVGKPLPQTRDMPGD